MHMYVLIILAFRSCTLYMYMYIVVDTIEMGIEHSHCCVLQAMTLLLEEAIQPLSDSSYYDTVYSIDTGIQVY